MPGSCPQKSSGATAQALLHRVMARLVAAVLPTALTGRIVVLSVLALSLIMADELHAQIPIPSNLSGSGSVVHVTDEQDRFMGGTLSPASETKSRANALYAEASLLLQGLDRDQHRALDQLREVATLDPHFAEAQLKIANLLLQWGQLAPALDQLKTATEANPDSVELKAALGYAEHLHGDNDNALRLCSEALKVDSGQLTAMRVVLEIAKDQHDLAGGVIRVEDILRAGNPVPASAWLTLARLYVEVAQGNSPPTASDVLLKTLLPIYQQAAARTPPDVGTLTLLADTYQDLGEKREALTTLQEAVALEPASVDIILRCADLESELGRPAEALKDYEDAYTLNPNLTGLRDMLGELYLGSNRFAEAGALLQEALADAPDNSTLAINLGIAYEGTHQLEKARDCFQRVFASPSCPVDAYLKLAAFQLGDKQVKEAGETIAPALTRFPKSAKVRFYEAIQCRYARNYEAALTHLEETRALATGAEAGVIDTTYYVECALTQSLAGRNDLVATTLGEGLAKYPDDANLMNELAYFWADRGAHLSEALNLSQHAIQLDPGNGPMEDTLGWVYFRMNRPKDALPYLQRAALLTNNDPVVLQHLGDDYLKLGLGREAIATWSRALEKEPGNRDLAERIHAALAQATDAHLRSAPGK